MWIAADLALGLCTVLRPQLAIGLLLATLPLFAHRALSPWRLHFILLLAVLELAYLCGLKKPWKGAVAAVRGNPVLLLGALYVTASLLSLSSLTPVALIEKHIYLLRTLPLHELPHHFATTLNLPERSREYAAISAFLTLQAYVFCLIVWREIRRDPRAGVRFAVALVAGVVVWSSVGLAEFFGVFRLDAIRGIYAFQFADNPLAPRLQSVSGNSGWFAQYLVFTLPYVAVFLAQQVSRRVRLLIVGLAIAMVEFVIVLTFQRGGWVASTVELCCLASSGVTLAWRRPSRRSVQTMAAAVARTTALLAVVMVIVISLLYLSARSGFQPGGKSALARYSGRLQSLVHSPERLQYARAAFDIGKLYPILGGGSESFGLRYRQQFLDPTGWYFDVQPKIDPTSAHDVYLQTFAGKGVVGLALLVAMCVCALWTCIRTLQPDSGVNRASRLCATMGGVSTVGFLVYGVVQEVFYVHALQVLFFCSLGFVAAATQGLLTWPAAVRRTLWVLLAALFVIHLGYEYVYPGSTRLARSPVVPQGLYWQERDEDGVPFRWTSSQAVFPVPDGATVFTLQVRSLAPTKQVVTVLLRGIPYGSYSLEGGEWRRLRFLLPASDRAHRSLQVEVSVTPTFESGGRTLGIMVGGVGFR